MATNYSGHLQQVAVVGACASQKACSGQSRGSYLQSCKCHLPMVPAILAHHHVVHKSLLTGCSASVG